ncbi:hypothetical protein [Niabella hibiscisoli]|uniref:hypothetical protein n=1 Tax=Niabella hibiscisoli TaxID=1825928 RepID=UPI001F10A754|nr:hypothetical protein [Niabella hibiscisoli]MCH5714784.1 hypothetical protein [Niabella hibiscisoli]
MKLLFIAAFISALPILSYAREKPPGRWAIKTEVLAQTAGAYAESIRIPGFKRQLSDGKGIQLGAEYLYIDHKNWQLFQSTGVMHYWHSKQEKGLAVHTSLGYRRKIGAAYIEGLIGPGYLETTFADGPTGTIPVGRNTYQAF